MFDQIVIVDFLEHIPDDSGFVRDLERIMKPGGGIIINVPHLKPHSLLNRFRHRIGLTDEWHGHLRPGYTLEGLRRLLGSRFVIERATTYSGTFSELIDTVLNALYLRMQAGQGSRGASSKGSVITGGDLQKHKKQFLFLSTLYPVIWTVAKLDTLLWLQRGYKLIVRARFQGAAAMARETSPGLDS
jgi:hypothetical protein